MWGDIQDIFLFGCPKTIDITGFFKKFCIATRTISGFSSSGRAPPCQGGGSEFEPRKPLHFFASVAQLVEQGTENPRVIGSIPIGGTTASEQSSLCSDAFFAKKRHPPAPLLLLLPTKFCSANFRGGPGRPGAAICKVRFAPTLFLQKSVIRPLPCSSFSPRNFASQIFARAPAAPRAAISGISLAATFFSKSRRAPAEIGTKGARCRSFLALHPL